MLWKPWKTHPGCQPNVKVQYSKIPTLGPHGYGWRAGETWWGWWVWDRLTRNKKTKQYVTHYNAHNSRRCCFCCCFNPMFFEKNSFAYQTFVGFVSLCAFLSASYFVLSSLRHLVTSTPPPPSPHKSIFFWSNDHRFHDSCFHKTWGWPGGSKVLKEDQGGSKGLCLGIFVGGYDEAYKALLTTTYPLKAYPRHPFQ